MIEHPQQFRGKTEILVLHHVRHHAIAGTVTVDDVVFIAEDGHAAFTATVRHQGLPGRRQN